MGCCSVISTRNNISASMLKYKTDDGIKTLWDEIKTIDLDATNIEKEARTLGIEKYVL